MSEIHTILSLDFQGESGRRRYVKGESCRRRYVKGEYGRRR